MDMSLHNQGYYLVSTWNNFILQNVNCGDVCIWPKIWLVASKQGTADPATTPQSLSSLLYMRLCEETDFWKVEHE